MNEHDLDLGDGHWLDFTHDGSEEKALVGAIVGHLKPDGTDCEGFVSWAPTKFARENPDRLTEHERDRPTWTLETAADEHITLSPSVTCGDHGFIRDGRWVRA